VCTYDSFVVKKVRLSQGGQRSRHPTERDQNARVGASVFQTAGAVCPFSRHTLTTPGGFVSLKPLGRFGGSQPPTPFRWTLKGVSSRKLCSLDARSAFSRRQGAKARVP